MLQSARNSFLNAANKFPAWLSIFKRPEKSVSGKFLLSVIEERDNLSKVLDDFKNSFFLTHYVENGIEEDVLSEVFIAPVNSEISDLITPKLSITTDTDIFLENLDGYALLQDDYLILHENTDDDLIYYKIAGATYSAPLTKFDVWNIFDEYALFLSLERFDGETNTQLAKRCLATFKNPANSTKPGLQNVIINALMNDLPIKRDEIIIETPNSDNLFLPDEIHGSVYENIAQLNQDIFRTKKFDFNAWQHDFRNLEWLPHKWDADIDLFQDGVGQLDDLKVAMRGDNDSETTDVVLRGYVKSQLLIDQYIRKNQFQRKMTLKLQKYLDTLTATTISYKIIAHETEKLDADHIKLESYSNEIVQRDYFLSDIIDDSANLTILNQGVIFNAGVYKLKFLPNSLHQPLNLTKVTLTDADGAVKNLVKENSRFKIVGGVLTDGLALIHLTKLKQATAYQNFVDSVDGITLAKNQRSGKISVDITEMSGASLSYEIVTPDLLDITYNDDFVTCEGFVFDAVKNTLTATDSDLDAYVDIDVNCAEISFDFLAADSVVEQGSVAVNIKINGGIDLINSGVWSAAKNFHRKFNSLTRVQIHIQKSSSNAVAIANIKTARYDVKLSTAKGAVVKTLLSTSLPVFDGDNSLDVEITAYDSISPILKYLHVGNDTISSHYEISDINVSANSKFDISADWRAELYKVENGSEILVDANFSTKSKFRNSTSQDIRASVNVDNFESITASSIPIHKTVYLGNAISYITVPAGETVDKITITGKLRAAHESYTLAELLNKSDDEDVYISAEVGAFILQNRSTLDERLVQIQPSAFKTDANNFVFVNLPPTAVGCFSQDIQNSAVIKNNRCENGFFNAWVELRQNIKYVAHNQAALLTAEISGVPVVDSWSPQPDTSKLMFYVIEMGENSSAPNSTVLFEKTFNDETVYENWSLGKKSFGLKITNLADNYNSEIFYLEEDYVVSNSIPFAGEREINGETQALAKFIITPPENMIVNYSEVGDSQNLNITNDGFSKLWYSNVSRIISVVVNGVVVDSGKYRLLSAEGIVCWLDKDLFGETAQIVYQHKIPQSVSYKNIAALYDSVPYSVDTYKILDETVTLKNLSAGDVKEFNFASEQPDKIISQCTNLNFLSVVNENFVTVNLVSVDNNLTVKTGYYYDDGVEYYFFNNIHAEAVNKLDNLELYNVSRVNDQYIFVSESTNYILDSSMKGTRLDKLCHIDCAIHDEISGVSKLGIFTACDNYNNWDDFGMTIELTANTDGYSVSFTPRDSNSYAITEISHGVVKNSTLSFKTTGNLHCQILREIKFDGEHLATSTFAEPLGDTTVSGDYSIFNFDSDTDIHAKYYLLVKGSGSVDDLIIAQNYSTVEQIHRKKIFLLGFLPELDSTADEFISLNFDSAFNSFYHTEMDSDGKISTTSNVAFGLTKIFALKDSRQEKISCSTEIYQTQNSFRAEDKDGTLTISDVYLPFADSVEKIFVKVNDVLIDNFTNFTVQLNAAAVDKVYRKISSAKKTNRLETSISAAYSYIQIVVNLSPNSVINNLEIFALYGEKSANLYVNTYDEGTFTTKIYDVGFAANYSLFAINGEVAHVENIAVFMRGLKEGGQGREVFTDWYKCELNADLNVVGNPHIFNSYRLFQFKIDFSLQDASIKIAEFILKQN